MIRKYKEHGEFIQSIVQTGAALAGGLVGSVAVMAYVMLLFFVAALFNFRKPADIEVAAFVFEALVIWWRTIVSTANWIYKFIDAPVDHFEQLEVQRGTLLVLRFLFGLGLITIHFNCLIKVPGNISTSFVGMSVAMTLLLPALWKLGNRLRRQPKNEAAIQIPYQIQSVQRES